MLLINFAKWLTLPRLRTLHALNAVTHFSWVEGSFISCGYQFSNLKGLWRFGEASCGPDAFLNCLSLHNWTSCLARLLWDNRLFLDLHGPELLQELGFLCWLWCDCFHPDPGSTKSVRKTRARVGWTRQLWFISQLKRSSWFLSLPEPTVWVCECVCLCEWYVCWTSKST